MKVFLTGATGFIGSYLVEELIGKGCQLLCLKRPTSSLGRLTECSAQILWVDITEKWQDVVRDFRPDAIFHLAWNGVAAKEREDWEAQISNISLLKELLCLACETDCDKFVCTGSQSEYGAFEQKITETYPTDPQTPYAAVKVAALNVMKCFCELNQIHWYWFRLFPLFGPYEGERWLIPSLIKSMCTQQYMDLTLGKQRLAYLYVGECAKALASVLDVDGNSGVYNVCADNPLPLRTLVEHIRDKVNPEFRLNFGALPYRHGQCMYMEGDTTALREHLYKLDTSTFEKHLDKTIDFYMQQYGHE